MAEGGGATTFPVSYYNGEKESSIGDITIHPQTVYETLHSQLAERVGVCPNKISIHLADEINKSQGLIDATSNFSEICSLEKPSSFLVILENQKFPRLEDAFYTVMPNKKFCQECTAAEKDGKTPDFHHCPNDVVV